MYIELPVPSTTNYVGIECGQNYNISVYFNHIIYHFCKTILLPDILSYVQYNITQNIFPEITSRILFFLPTIYMIELNS